MAENMKCMECGYRFDAHMNTGTGRDEQPENGDMGICFGCGALYFFSNNGLVEVTAEEYNMLPPKVQAYIVNIRYAIERVKDNMQGGDGR